MPKSSIKKRKSSTPPSGKGSILESIEQLRNFCPGFEEGDLSACLRASGYNVELAASNLLTGEWKKTAKDKSAFFRLNSAVLSPTKKETERGKQSKRTKLATTTANSAKKAPTPSKRKTTPTPKAAPKKQPPATVTPSPKQEPPLLKESFLLCTRWLDGSSLSRNGKVKYKQKFTMTPHKTGRPVVRFKADDQVEGTLPAKVGAMIAPLQDLIHLEAESMLNQPRVGIGHAVPMSLRYGAFCPLVCLFLFPSSHTMVFFRSACTFLIRVRSSISFQPQRLLLVPLEHNSLLIKLRKPHQTINRRNPWKKWI